VLKIRPHPNCPKFHETTNIGLGQEYVKCPNASNFIKLLFLAQDPMKLLFSSLGETCAINSTTPKQY